MGWPSSEQGCGSHGLLCDLLLEEPESSQACLPVLENNAAVSRKWLPRLGPHLVVRDGAES